MTAKRTLAKLISTAILVLSPASTLAIPGVKNRRGSPQNTNVLGPVAEIKLVNKVIAPDGFNRSAVLAGGTFPGPLIQAHIGDEFRINVINELTDTDMNTTTSIHWHGIFQHQSNWADGVAFVTQCPIPPNDSFLYHFTVPDQAGTFWYHSHLAVQYCDGLRAPLVIYDDKDPYLDWYDVDDASTVIVLSDWYHLLSPQMYNLVPFISDSILINGLGRYEGGPKSPLSVIDVEFGKRYRFRLIGTSCDAWLNFTIDGHVMTIIETDGIETVPVTVDALPIFAGQRYSVIVTADQPVDNYWIRAFPNHGPQTFDGGLNSAILRYAGAPIQEPTTQQGPSVLPFDENLLSPLLDAGAPGIPEPGKADVNINFVTGSTLNGLFTMDGVSFIPPSFPILLQILSGAGHPSQLLPGGSVYELPYNKTIEISIPATDLDIINGAPGAPHPFHLHGHIFDVVRVAGSSTYNYANPVRRDTVSTGTQVDSDNVTIRFVTDNPGPWFLHCHIDWHLHSGFGVVMAEALQETFAQEHPPDYWSKLCSATVN